MKEDRDGWFSETADTTATSRSPSIAILGGNCSDIQLAELPLPLSAYLEK
jgi:hypothetical protein